MKTITSLLLVGLLGCVKPQTIEAPVSVQIEPMKVVQPESDVVVINAPKWYVERANPWHTDVISSSRFEAIYGYGDYKITARVAKGLMFLECSSGATTISRCEKDGASFTYTCNDMPLTIKCQFVKIVNGVEEEIPKNKDEQPEPESNP